MIFNDLPSQSPPFYLTIWFIGVVLFFLIPFFWYKFSNPELTDTQLIFDFFKAYKEFFNGNAFN